MRFGAERPVYLPEEVREAYYNKDVSAEGLRDDQVEAIVVGSVPPRGFVDIVPPLVAAAKRVGKMIQDIRHS